MSRVKCPDIPPSPFSQGPTCTSNHTTTISKCILCHVSNQLTCLYSFRFLKGIFARMRGWQGYHRSFQCLRNTFGPWLYGYNDHHWYHTSIRSYHCVDFVEHSFLQITGIRMQYVCDQAMDGVDCLYQSWLLQAIFDDHKADGINLWWC